MADRVRITVKLSPKAARSAVSGWTDGPDGHPILKCSVTAAPEKDKANKALIKLLAAHWRVPASNISIVLGHKDKLKTLEIQGFDQDLLPLHFR